MMMNRLLLSNALCRDAHMEMIILMLYKGGVAANRSSRFSVAISRPTNRAR